MLSCWGFGILVAFEFSFAVKYCIHSLIFACCMMVVTATRNGPGFLVAWPPGEGGHRVYMSREPSPTFYEVDGNSCCPVLPNRTRPCCPVYSSTLQVEGGLDAGSSYRFRVISEAGVVVGISDPERAATVSVAPGAPDLQPAAGNFDPGAIYDVTFAAPPDDGGDLVRGYRIVANITSLNMTGTVLVANTSSTRPVAEWQSVAVPRHSRLPLLPGHLYSMAVQALNTVGASPLGPALVFQTSVGPIAEHELPMHGWRRGRVERGTFSRHTFFLHPAIARARVVLQHSMPSSCCSSLHERRRLLSSRALALHVQPDALPPDTPFWPQADAGSVDTTGPNQGSNSTASMGELSVTIAYPSSQWYNVVVHAAALEGDAAEYDVRVEAETEEAGSQRGTPDAAGRLRYDTLSAPWRHREGTSSHHDAWIVRRHMHPFS